MLQNQELPEAKNNLALEAQLEKYYQDIYLKTRDHNEARRGLVNYLLAVPESD